MDKKNVKVNRNNKRWVRNALFVLAADMIGVWAVFFIALFLRFDLKYTSIPQDLLSMYIYLMPLWCVFTAVVFYIMKLYHSIWSFVSLDEAVLVGKSYIILAILDVGSFRSHLRKTPRLSSSE